MNPLRLLVLLVTLPLLLGGCGGKDESTTETKPVEEKVLEVKEEAKTEEPLAETKPELEGVPEEKLELREGIWYLKGQDTPFTGKVFSLHENGQKKAEGNFKDGKLNGLQMTWYENGQKFRKGNFKDGKEDGLGVQWYENGQKAGEANAKDGKHDGLQLSWHENGKKRLEVNYKDGKEVEGSAKFWNSKGEPVDTIEEADKE